MYSLIELVLLWTVGDDGYNVSIKVGSDFTNIGGEKLPCVFMIFGGLTCVRVT